MTENAVKTCTTCLKTLDIDNFPRRKVSKDGRRGQCRKCLREYQTKWRHNGAEKPRALEPETSKSLRCTSCHKRKYTSEFNLDSKSVTGYAHRCRSCQSEYWKDYVQRKYS